LREVILFFEPPIAKNQRLGLNVIEILTDYVLALKALTNSPENIVQKKEKEKECIPFSQK
jgi:hypothetical protein